MHAAAPRYWQANSQLTQSTLAKPQIPKKPPAFSTFSAAKPGAITRVSYTPIAYDKQDNHLRAEIYKRKHHGKGHITKDK